MRIHNLYVDASGASHFRDIDIEWVQESPGGKLSRRLPATGVIFRETSGDYDLDAGVELTASDGEKRIIGAGEVIFVEDTTGQGHLSKAVSGQVRHSIFIPID